MNERGTLCANFFGGGDGGLKKPRHIVNFRSDGGGVGCVSVVRSNSSARLEKQPLLLLLVQLLPLLLYHPQ